MESPAASVTPLWAFTTGGLTYTFDATSMSSFYDATARIWDISGYGFADITGGSTSYVWTEGSWNADVGVTGSSFFFGSAASVPDGGLTLGLLGCSLMALSALRRKLS